MIPTTYGDRPACILLSGGLFGLLLSTCHLPPWVSIGAVAVLLALLVVKRLREEYATPILLLLWGLLFGLYATARSETIDRLPPAATYTDIPITLLHPMGRDSVGARRYRAEVRIPHKAVILLTIPAHHPIPALPGVALSGIATLDLNASGSVGGASFRRYLRSEGIDGVGSLHAIKELRPEPTASLLTKLTGIRAVLIRHFDEKAGGVMGEEARTLLYALTLGERSLLPEEVRTDFTSSGVAHILAVSGYHLGVVYLLLLLLLRRLMPYHHRRQIRYIILLGGLILYTLLTGAAASTVRALLMSAIVIFGRLLDRPTDGLQALALTLLLILIAAPYMIGSPGLLLSASAVWGIILFYPLFERVCRPHHPLLRYLYGLIAVSVAAQLGAFPWLLYFFGESSMAFLWSSIPVTLLSIPIIPAGLLLIGLTALLPETSLLAPLYQALSFLCEGMIATTRYISDTFPVAIRLGIDLPAVLLYYAVLHFAYRLLASRLSSSHYYPVGIRG